MRKAGEEPRLSPRHAHVITLLPSSWAPGEPSEGRTFGQAAHEPTARETQMLSSISLACMMSHTDQTYPCIVSILFLRTQRWKQEEANKQPRESKTMSQKCRQAGQQWALPQVSTRTGQHTRAWEENGQVLLSESGTDFAAGCAVSSPFCNRELRMQSALGMPGQLTPPPSDPQCQILGGEINRLGVRVSVCEPKELRSFSSTSLRNVLSILESTNSPVAKAPWHPPAQ